MSLIVRSQFSAVCGKLLTDPLPQARQALKSLVSDYIALRIPAQVSRVEDLPPDFRPLKMEQSRSELLSLVKRRYPQMEVSASSGGQLGTIRDRESYVTFNFGKSEEVEAISFDYRDLDYVAVDICERLGLRIIALATGSFLDMEAVKKRRAAELAGYGERVTPEKATWVLLLSRARESGKLGSEQDRKRILDLYPHAKVALGKALGNLIEIGFDHGLLRFMWCPCENCRHMHLFINGDDRVIPHLRSLMDVLKCEGLDDCTNFSFPANETEKARQLWRNYIESRPLGDPPGVFPNEKN